MDFFTWQQALGSALTSSGSSLKPAMLDQQAMVQAYNQGMSPVVFARTASMYVAPVDSGLGACPQCGSRDLFDKAIYNDNSTARIFVILMAVVTCIGLLLLPFLTNKRIGTRRICRKCGNAWAI